MSGLLELLQEYCTFGHRNGDWLDLAANTMGVTLGALIGLLMYQLWFKRKR
jgi:glycopeptide antibiotics resistance protein